jgi:hypothetical protein
MSRNIIELIRGDVLVDELVRRGGADNGRPVFSWTPTTG